MSAPPATTTSTTGEREGTLQLPDNRQLAYAENGNGASRTVVLFFSGYLSVGSARSVPAPLRDLDAHFVAPTIPGNGESSATPTGIPYHVSLCRDMTALLHHLHPDGIDALYVGGGSYGSVPAQMLYGADHAQFAAGRQLRGLLLAAPFSPFRLHAAYGRAMTWLNWVSVGPPSQWVPFRLVPRLLSLGVAAMVRDVATAHKTMHGFAVGRMDGEERRAMEAWLAAEGIGEDEWIGRMAAGAVRCTRSWAAFLEGPDVLHSDWGFVPGELDAEHRRPVLIVGGDRDELGDEMNVWLKENYANSALKIVHGGHIASLFTLDESWRQLLAMKQ